MIERDGSYERMYARFRWQIPQQFNAARELVERHAPDRPAMIVEQQDGQTVRWTFGDFVKGSARLANALGALGASRGDRVGILLSQSPELALTHIACYRAGLIALPLFTLFGEEAIEYRLGNAGAAVVVTDMANVGKVLAARARLPDLRQIIVVGAGSDSADFLDYAGLMERSSDSFETLDTSAEDPHLLIYTSGTTGQPKGALHVHRALLGHIPAMQQWTDFGLCEGQVMWTPAEWAWIAGLYDALFPAWYYGLPVVSHRFAKFDPERAFSLIDKHGITLGFIPPTALKMMRQVSSPQLSTRMHSVFTGGEAMGAGLLDWGRSTFGLEISEGYGQTEMNLMVTNSPRLFPIRPGSCGRAVFGRRIAIVDDAGNVLPFGTEGHIAGWRKDPVVMKEYWANPEGTRRKFAGEWLLTGDLGSMDDAGYIWFKSRDDDVITSGGYRIGPGEVEECLMRHPAVANVGVVGVPDEARTEIVKAFVQTKPGVQADDALKAEIADYVKTRLAAHEYPREVEFVDELPLTTTGKIMRRELKRLDAERKAAARAVDPAQDATAF